MVDSMVSVIIANTKNENNTRRCIESVLNQTYSSYEIIIIHNNNIDNIIKNDKNIKFYDRSLSNSDVLLKKQAIKECTGEYIFFIDGNDYIKDNTLNDLMVIAKKYKDISLIVSSITSEYVEGCIKEEYKNYGVCNQKQYTRYINEFLKNTNSFNYLNLYFGKLFKTCELIKYYTIPDDIVYEESTAFMTYMLLSIDSIYIVENAYYIRNKKEDFVFIDDDFIYEFQKTYEYLKNFFITLQDRENMINRLGNYYLNHILKDYKNLKYIKYDLDIEKIFEVREYYKNIVLYGAGYLGKLQYHMLSNRSDVNIISWVDKNLAGEYVEDILISEVSKIIEYDYDIILIAVWDRHVFDIIKNELQSLYKIDSDKIKWYTPVRIMEIKN